MNIEPDKKPVIIILTTALSSYLAADALGQTHTEYPANTYIIKTIDPVMFPEYFYLNSFAKGVDGIIIASAGTDCPFEGAYDQLSKTVANVQKAMKEKGMSVKRLRLTAICSVCTHPLIKEINQMVELTNKLANEGKQ